MEISQSVVLFAVWLFFMFDSFVRSSRAIMQFVNCVTKYIYIFFFNCLGFCLGFDRATLMIYAQNFKFISTLQLTSIRWLRMILFDASWIDFFLILFELFKLLLFFQRVYDFTTFSVPFSYWTSPHHVRSEWKKIEGKILQFKTKRQTRIKCTSKNNHFHFLYSSYQHSFFISSPRTFISFTFCDFR